MGLEIGAKVILSDTLVPDIFISEYLPVLSSESVKVYIYSLYLSKKGDLSYETLNRILSIDELTLKGCLEQLETTGLLYIRNKKITVCDIKERELNKYYRPKTSLDVLDNKTGEKVASKRSAMIRNGVIKRISDIFFCGQMAPSWYGEIDLWFEKYSFDDEVMFMLFQQCYDSLSKAGKPLNKAYIASVARSWSEKGIRTHLDVEKYSIEFEQYSKVKYQVVKKLKKIDSLTEYEEKIIEKWFYDYKYSLDIIELSLRKSVALNNASLYTYDKFLTEWFNAGLRTKEAVIEYEEKKKKANAEKYAAKSGKIAVVPQKNNYEQRKYDDEFFESVYKKVGNSSND